MKTIEDARNHCRFVGEGIEKSVADGEDLFARFEGTPILRSKVEREGGGHFNAQPGRSALSM